MELHELAVYAREKYHIFEEHKWKDFPGYSVLVDPNTQKWVALLMRSWNSDRGEHTELCDLKCGQQTLLELDRPYLSKPFRMNGEKWIGVVFDDRTEPEVIYRLFERALFYGEQRGYTMVLDMPEQVQDSYAGTPLPQDGRNYIDFGRIRDMRRMGLGNRPDETLFYRQALFMADYEPEYAPVQFSPKVDNGSIRSYNELGVSDLYGYFCWRAKVRRDELTDAPKSFYFLYGYELINGIGAERPEAVFELLCRYYQLCKNADNTWGKPIIELKRWITDYAVIHGLPPEPLHAYEDSFRALRDRMLLVLRNPREQTDEAIVKALGYFDQKTLDRARSLEKSRETATHLYAAFWRRGIDGIPGFFERFFGTRRQFPKTMMYGGVYLDRGPFTERTYELNPCRSFVYSQGSWQEIRYDVLYFDKEAFSLFLHESERQIRGYLGTGRNLKQKSGINWAVPIMVAVLEDERRAAEEAAKPKISIDLNGLERIRQDAEVTRDSLLTDEEMEKDGLAEWAGPPDNDNCSDDRPESPDFVINGSAEMESIPAAVQPDRPGGKVPVGTAGQSRMPPAPEGTDGCPDGLTGQDVEILRILLQGGDAGGLLQAVQRMPSVAADEINEALFDRIGDNVVEWDGTVLSLVEDYREDLMQILD
ncbi:MAG: TerB N-terminal domain-containing protein [Clostridia bacterium]|nr:TerB N-terminal domain-containing protein [Clostridia bacterium]